MNTPLSPQITQLPYPFTYNKAIKHLYAHLPMYQRIGAAAYKKDLTNIIKLCEMLGNPQTKFKTIHVAGTNGKGSVSHILAAMLHNADFKNKVGLYISPHYKDFRERIKINGRVVPKREVIEFIQKHQAEYMKIQPSFFELSVAMAFDYFARKCVDVAVIETGLGGRLDSTNIITPVLSVITNIGYDHQQFLGNTLQEIASEKAGIIKPGVPVVIGETDPEVAPVFIQAAQEKNAPIDFADQHVKVVLKSKEPMPIHQKMTVDIYEDDKLVRENVKTDLYGSFQLKNIATAWYAARKLKDLLGFKLENIMMGISLSMIGSSTNFKGRWQLLPTIQKENGPLVVCDSAHNEPGLKVSLAELKELPCNNLHIVLGFVKDKDLSKMLPLFPANAKYYFCKPDIPRGLDAHELQQQAAAYGLHGDVYPSVQWAYYQGAQKNAQKGDVIFIGGSTYVVAEVIW